MNGRISAPAAALLELDEIADRLARVLELSTADTAELAWVETRGGSTSVGQHGGAEHGEGPKQTGPVRRSVLIRAREGARHGAYHTGSGEPSEILWGLRQAVAASRGAEPLPSAGAWEQEKEPTPVPSEPAAEPAPAGPAPDTLWDPAVAALDPAAATVLARDLLAGGSTRRERLDLEWSLLRVVVRNSEGLDRRAETTAVTVRARSGPAGASPSSPGSGWATGAARTLGRLDGAAIVRRAREWTADGVRPAERGGALTSTEGPILFSSEAAASLVRVLVRVAFPSSAFDYGRSPLSGLLGEHVFAPGINLIDDGLGPTGMPFPFDLRGRSRRRIELVADGVPRTPAVDEHLAVRLKRPPTPHALGPGEARPIHPFLLPREGADEVLAAAEGGIWIADFSDLECFDRGRVAVRGRTLGARRVVGGRLAEAIEPMIWEDSLLRLFSKVHAVGGEPAVLVEAGGMGGVSAPMVCVAGAERLTRAGSA